jgi:hypothetical protein
MLTFSPVYMLSFTLAGDILLTYPGDILLWGDYPKVRSVLNLGLGCNTSCSLL